MSGSSDTKWKYFGSPKFPITESGFINNSQAIWEEMRQDTPYGQPDPICGEFGKIFYGAKRGELIDYERVVRFIKEFNKDHTKIFKWSDFNPKPVKEPEVWIDREGEPHETGGTVDRFYTVPYSYTNEQGKKIITEISGKLNKRVCYLESDINKQWSFRISIDGSKRRIETSLSLYYKDTYNLRQDAVDTVDRNDFRIDDQYRAIALNTASLDDFTYLVKDIYGENKSKAINSRITEKYIDALKIAGTANNINFLYKKMPEFVIKEIAAKKLISREMFLKHLVALEIRDEMSWTKDSSPAVIKLIRCMGDIKFLYELAFSYPAVFKTFFYALDGSSTFQGQELTNKTIFAIIFLVVCQVNGYAGFSKDNIPLFQIGNSYEVGNYLRPPRDKYTDRYTLTQQQVIKERKKVYSKEGSWYDTFPRLVKIGETGHYYPLQPVRFMDMTSETPFPKLVPAIYVKSIAHQQKVADIMGAVRILADLLAIVLGIASLGTGSVLYIFLGLLDIGIAATDLVVMSQQDELMKTAEGREYLDNWNTFAFVGGIATAGPLLVRSTYLLGARLLGKVTITETKNFLQSTMKGMLLESGVTGFIPDSIKVLEVAEVAALSKLGISTSEAAKLYDAGIIFVKGETKVAGKTVEEIAVVYQGEVIAKGEASKIGKRILDDFAESGNIPLRWELLESVPEIKQFEKWFDGLKYAEFQIVWRDLKLRETIMIRLRHPGGYHEWLMVSRANKFKGWGVSVTEIKKLRTKIEEVIFVDPPGVHGGPGSTKAHNEILRLIDNAQSYKSFKQDLIKWADKRLSGGSNSLPGGFFDN